MIWLLLSDDNDRPDINHRNILSTRLTAVSNHQLYLDDVVSLVSFIPRLLLQENLGNK